jgi:hypothetical protein
MTDQAVLEDEDVIEESTGWVAAKKWLAHEKVTVSRHVRVTACDMCDPRCCTNTTYLLPPHYIV